MSWETFRAHYLTRMQLADAVLSRARDLQSQQAANLTAKIGQKLDQLAPQLARQLKKLRDNQFHVAVLGLEKAGKSALINAWLGAEILPSRDERCTYTPTEIWSAPSERDQSYEIEYRTPEEFAEELDQKRKAHASLAAAQRQEGQDFRDLDNDLEETRGLEAQIRPLLGRSPEKRSFLDIREIRQDLTRVITDPAYARAVRRIILRTTALRAARDLVFHDVPGFNSPLEMHKQQAQQKIAECDAILYAKDFRSPNREGTEVRMLRFADIEDPAVKAAGKTFVVLTRIDTAEDVQHFRELLESARREWRGIPPDRVLPVCPPALLFRNGAGREEVMRYGPNIVARLAQLGVGDGIDELKRAVQAYIDGERSSLLARRCDRILADLRRVARDLVNQLEERFPEFSGNYQEDGDRRFEIAFNAWWTQEWTRIRKDLGDFYDSKVMPKVGREVDAEPSDNPELTRFRGRYRDLVHGFEAALPSASPDKIQELYKVHGRTGDGRFLPVSAHIAIRKVVHQEAVKHIDGIGRDLAADLNRSIGELTSKMVELLWGIKGIEEALDKDLGPIEPRIEHGVSTLFLRFARPAAEIFLTAPRGVPDRRVSLKERAPDIKALAEFYEGVDPAHKDLEHFLDYGSWRPLSAPPPPPLSASEAGSASRHASPPAFSGVTFRKIEVPGTSKPATPEPEPAPQPREDLARPSGPAADFASILAEIQEDLRALVDYLENSVFTASGFKAYWHQELSRVWKTFEDLEEGKPRLWSALVRHAYDTSVPAVLAAAPQLGEDEGFGYQVAQSLEQLRQALAGLDGPDLQKTEAPTEAPEPSR